MRVLCASTLSGMATKRVATHRGLSDLEGLECPATWRSSIVGPDACEDMLDKLCLAATPWTGTMERLKLAWSLHASGHRDQGRQLLVECFMSLLPYAMFHKNCDLIADYREALRCVLDATWAIMCIYQLDGGAEDVSNLEKFIAGAKRTAQMDVKQRAAVLAIRGRLSGTTEGETLLRKAVALNPQEGKWRYVLGWMLQERRKRSGKPSKEEVELLREAYRLRKNPDTILRLARTILEQGRGKEAERLVNEALTLYPNHPRVLTNAANIMSMLTHISESERFRMMRALYLRAQDEVGERAFIHFRLANLARMQGDLLLAAKHLDAARRLNPRALNHITTGSQ